MLNRYLLSTDLVKHNIEINHILLPFRTKKKPSWAWSRLQKDNSWDSKIMVFCLFVLFFHYMVYDLRCCCLTLLIWISWAPALGSCGNWQLWYENTSGCSSLLRSEKGIHVALSLPSRTVCAFQTLKYQQITEELRKMYMLIQLVGVETQTLHF